MHPEGITLHMRSIDSTQTALEQAGFADVSFHPFDIPIDLPFPGHDAELLSYTRKEELSGSRMTFRGALYQPWCHLVAQGMSAAAHAIDHFSRPLMHPSCCSQSQSFED